MLMLSAILGVATDPEVADRLHHISHHGVVEHLTLNAADMKRHRLRIETDKGTLCAIALPREQTLCNGAVLFLADDRAIVVRMAEQPVIKISPTDAAAALELGYLAGNMHWKVSFSGTVLVIAQEGEAAAYLARLSPLLDSGRVVRLDDDD